MNILMVEDHDENRELATMLLEMLGDRVIAAATGASTLWALSSAGVKWPDAVLLDIDLPDTNGWSVLERLRMMGCEAPVWVVTAYDVEEAALARGCKFARKPVDFPELRAEIAAKIEPTRAARTAER